MPNDPIVDEAIQSVLRRYSLSELAALPPREITSQIYQEVRRLDLIAIGQAPGFAAPRQAA